MTTLHNANSTALPNDIFELEALRRETARAISSTNNPKEDARLSERLDAIETAMATFPAGTPDELALLARYLEYEHGHSVGGSPDGEKHLETAAIRTLARQLETLAGWEHSDCQEPCGKGFEFDLMKGAKTPVRSLHRSTDDFKTFREGMQNLWHSFADEIRTSTEFYRLLRRNVVEVIEDAELSSRRLALIDGEIDYREGVILPMIEGRISALESGNGKPSNGSHADKAA